MDPKIRNQRVDPLQMRRSKEKDELLERLWCLQEEGLSPAQCYRDAIAEKVDTSLLAELGSEALIELDGSAETLRLAERGREIASGIIRAHRLGERLVCDVLNEEFESSACEFEHTLTPELVDSICTLLGHPRDCPHGKRIPEGDCCRRSERTARTSVIPLTELDPGEGGRIAYVECGNDWQMHRLAGLQIRPGVSVRLHQKFPTVVVECEGLCIALDSEIADHIRVWTRDSSAGHKAAPGGSGLFAGFRHRHGRKP